MALTVSVEGPPPFKNSRHSDTENGLQHLSANLCFMEGRCTAIMGRTGAGKTSLLRCITGLDHYANAHVQINGAIYQGNQIFIAPHKRRFGVIFQHHNLFEHLSVLHNLQYAIKRRPKNANTPTLNDTSEAFQIQHLMRKMPSTLSGGEKQMVALARTALSLPKALLLDEPLTNIDNANKATIIGAIRQFGLENNIPVVIITHNLSEVAQLADDLAVIENGRVIASGPLVEVTSDIHQPLAQSPNAAAIIEATITSHDPDFGLTQAEINGHPIHIKLNQHQQGNQCRIRIYAKDVSLCRQRPTDSSILNILPVVIEDMITLEKTHVLIKLNLGGQALLSRITAKSCAVLGLQKGQAVFAQMKSVALATNYE